MHLDGALEFAVMRVFHVGVAPADMRDHHRILAFQRAKQLVRGVDGVGRGLALDQDVRRAADRAALAAIEDVAVAAHAGVARPFVAGKADELARLVEFGGQLVELLPERIGDLKVVALVADHVDEGRVARIAEVILRRAHADGFAALPVQIAPVAAQRRGFDHTQRIGAGDLGAVRHQTQIEVALGVGDEALDYPRSLARLDRDRFLPVMEREPAQRARNQRRLPRLRLEADGALLHGDALCPVGIADADADAASRDRGAAYVADGEIARGAV